MQKGDKREMAASIQLFSPETCNSVLKMYKFVEDKHLNMCDFICNRYMLGADDGGMNFNVCNQNTAFSQCDKPVVFGGDGLEWIDMNSNLLFKESRLDIKNTFSVGSSSYLEVIQELHDDFFHKVK